jgi:hypothetical protein
MKSEEDDLTVHRVDDIYAALDIPRPDHVPSHQPTPSA